MKIRIGIQGDRGSTNERACLFFAQKHHWDEYEIIYLLTTEGVLDALQKENINYGTFAWESSRGGLVQETQKAIKRYSYEKIDEQTFQLDHALLSSTPIDTGQTVSIYSHPQALKEHQKFLRNIFPHLVLREEIDTALAAKNLRDGKYPKNSLVIAPESCAKLYSLNIFQKDLPSNVGYLTTIYLIKR